MKNATTQEVAIFLSPKDGAMVTKTVVMYFPMRGRKEPFSQAEIDARVQKELSRRKRPHTAYVTIKFRYTVNSWKTG